MFTIGQTYSLYMIKLFSHSNDYANFLTAKNMIFFRALIAESKKKNRSLFIIKVKRESEREIKMNWEFLVVTITHDFFGGLIKI